MGKEPRAICLPSLFEGKVRAAPPPHRQPEHKTSKKNPANGLRIALESATLGRKDPELVISIRNIALSSVPAPTFACNGRRQWHPTPVLLPEKSHGRRSLVGCSPWGPSEPDSTERLHLCFSLSCIGEGNGNLLQCSCLEDPRDGGAWWAAIYGVAQSRTRLK